MRRHPVAVDVNLPAVRLVSAVRAAEEEAAGFRRLQVVVAPNRADGFQDESAAALAVRRPPAARLVSWALSEWFREHLSPPSAIPVAAGVPTTDSHQAGVSGAGSPSNGVGLITTRRRPNGSTA